MNDEIANGKTFRQILLKGRRPAFSPPAGLLCAARHGFRRHDPFSKRAEIGSLSFPGLARQREDLAGPDEIGFADLILIREIDGGVADAAPIDTAGNVPKRICRGG